MIPLSLSNQVLDFRYSAFFEMKGGFLLNRKVLAPSVPLTFVYPGIDFSATLGNFFLRNRSLATEHKKVAKSMNKTTVKCIKLDAIM